MDDTRNRHADRERGSGMLEALIGRTLDAKQSVLERSEDISELNWLLDDCRNKYRSIEDADSARYPLHFFADRMEGLAERLALFQEKPEDCTLTDVLESKQEMRILLRQLAGILTSSDWHSPSVTPGPVKGKGERQAEENVYLRTSGSEYVKRFGKDFFEEFYEMSLACRKRSAAFLTESGMKALEVALMVYRLMTNNRLPLYYQVGYYFEGMSLVRDWFPEGKPVTVEEIGGMFERNDPIGCLLLEPGVTWPPSDGVRLDELFAKLRSHRQEEPLFLIIDRTLTGVTNQFFRDYGDLLPDHAVLVSVESGIKYLQLGMELTNLGFAVFSGSPMSRFAAQETAAHCMEVLSAIPDTTLVYRLPKPSMPILMKRMERLGRNLNLLYRFFSEKRASGRVSSLYHSVQFGQPYYAGLEPWNGSLLYVQLPQAVTFQEYERLAAQWVARSSPDLHLHFGGSFGFDAMRLNAVQESPERNDNSALRLSVGRDTLSDLARKLDFFDRMLSEKR